MPKDPEGCKSRVWDSGDAATPVWLAPPYLHGASGWLCESGLLGKRRSSPLGQFRVTSANDFGAAVVRACVDAVGKRRPSRWGTSRVRRRDGSRGRARRAHRSDGSGAVGSAIAGGTGASSSMLLCGRPVF